MTQVCSQGEPTLVRELTDISSDISLSLPETPSSPSTPSITSQTPITTLPLNFSTKLDDQYREVLTINIPLHLDWKTFVASANLYG